MRSHEPDVVKGILTSGKMHTNTTNEVREALLFAVAQIIAMNVVSKMLNSNNNN